VDVTVLAGVIAEGTHGAFFASRALSRHLREVSTHLLWQESPRAGIKFAHLRDPLVLSTLRARGADSVCVHGTSLDDVLVITASGALCALGTTEGSINEVSRITTWRVARLVVLVGAVGVISWAMCDRCAKSAKGVLEIRATTSRVFLQAAFLAGLAAPNKLVATARLQCIDHVGMLILDSAEGLLSGEKRGAKNGHHSKD